MDWCFLCLDEICTHFPLDRHLAATCSPVILDGGVFYDKCSGLGSSTGREIAVPRTCMIGRCEMRERGEGPG